MSAPNSQHLLEAGPQTRHLLGEPGGRHAPARRAAGPRRGRRAWPGSRRRRAAWPGWRYPWCRARSSPPRWRRGGSRASVEHGEPVDARHPDVEEDEVEGLRLEGAQRALAVGDRRHVVAGLAQALFQDPAQAVLVVGDEDRARSWSPGDGEKARHHGARGLRLLSTWMAPAVLLEDAVADGEAEPEAARLRGEERIEDLGPDRGEECRSPRRPPAPPPCCAGPPPRSILPYRALRLHARGERELAAVASWPRSRCGRDCGTPERGGPRRRGWEADSDRSGGRW